MARDLYQSYQNWINTLNPDTAPSVVTDPADYASPADFDRMTQQPFSLPARGQTLWDAEQEELRLQKLREQERIAAEEHAIKLRGQMNYQRDVQAGIPPQEAFRRNVSDLLFSNPERMSDALQAPVKAPDFINATPIRAGEKTLGYSVVDRVTGRPQSTTWTSDRPSYDEQQAHRVAMQAWRNTRQDLTTLLRMDPTARMLTPDYNQRLQAATEANRLAEQDAKLRGRAPSISSQAAVPPIESAPVGPAQPKTKAEFDRLPKGAQYINPSDGKTYIKK
jgi:hypothetical protein